MSAPERSAVLSLADEALLASYLRARHDAPVGNYVHVAPTLLAPSSVVSSSPAVACPMLASPILVPVASAPSVLPAAPTPRPAHPSPAGWVELRQSVRARNATYNPHDMHPLHSALISPSYDEFLASSRRDLIFEEFVAAMRFAPPQFPVAASTAYAPPPVVPRFRRPPRHGNVLICLP